jgi:hypothetical protein
VLAEQPSLVPNVGPSPVSVREMQSGSGPLDVVIVDLDGQITLVECKLASNAQVRREIVGQVLDYASSLWRMTFDDLDSRWRQRDPKGEGILDALGAEGDEALSLRATLSDNLAAGRFNLVLAVDAINDGLRRIIEFLNDRTAAELSVMAVELRYAKHGDVEMLVPTVFGAELAQVKVDRSDKRPQWTEADLHDYMSSQWPRSATALSAFLDAARALPGIKYVGTNAGTPSLIARWDGVAGTAWPFVVYTSKNPHVRLNFHWMTCIDADRKVAFAREVAALSGVTFDPEQIADKGFVSRPALSVADVLETSEAREMLVDALARLLAETGPRSE